MILAFMFMVILPLNICAMKSEKIYQLSEVDEQPEFPGGETAMYKWITDNLKWDSDEYISGQVVIEFNITEDGRVEDVRIKQGICPPFDKTILKMLSSMPRWQPAKISGHPVKVTRPLLMTFKSPKNQ